MDTNTYLARQYGPQPCWELVADVYATELDAVPVDYKTVNRSVRQMAAAFRLAIHKSPHGFVQLPEPIDMCIVLLGKTERVGIHHCGVYHAGRVLHALPGITLFEDLATLRATYALCEFWARQP